MSFKLAEHFAALDYAAAPESAVPAQQWLQSHKAGFGHFIDGKFTAPGNKLLRSQDPATGAKLARFTQGSKKDVAKAVAAARRSQRGWYAIGGYKRARVLYALARMVQRNARLFAVLESLNNGKPIRESRDIDVPLVARHFYHYAGWAQLQPREFSDFEPHGVVGQIVPWNFPLLMLAWKVAPALALGNTVVLKPAEQTPLTALLFAELAAQAGLPRGVLNIVTGDGRTGEHLVGATGVDKLAFTGSTQVGKAIRVATAGSGKALTLELGGKSPFIVFADADLDAAVEGIVDGVWFNQGQVCCAGSRLIAQESIADRLIAKLCRRLDTMRIGMPLDKNTDVGVIVSRAQHKRISALVAQGVSDGAGIHQANCALPDAGRFFPPTLLVDPSPGSRAVTEEIFGPVLVSTTFRTPAEAVSLANNTRYGLAASVYSETLGLALDIAPQLSAGVVWVNATNLFDAAVGFGGYRESGFGREGGFEGALEYLRPRTQGPRKLRATAPPVAPNATAGDMVAKIDRTAKQFIGGRQCRPDGGYSYPVYGRKGAFLGEAALGNRKDIRNAVESARNAVAWTRATTYARSQIMYYMAENLSARAGEFANRLKQMTGALPTVAEREVAVSIERLFCYAAWADKFEGRIHSPPVRGVALAMREPLGVVGVLCPPEAPLLAFISLIAPLLATGNRVVAIPSERHPLVATDYYQVVETSDLPAGALNVITGKTDDLLPTLAEHLDVDGIWVCGTAAQSAQVELLSVGNLKRVFADHGVRRDWTAAREEGEVMLHRAVQVKNIWIPYGE